MQARALSKYIHVSPYKLRSLADVVRGDRVDKALAWLKTCSMKRAVPLAKTIFSAYSNAKNSESEGVEAMEQYVIKELRIDAGPITRYQKPAAMGRASAQRRRLSHIHVVVEKLVR